MRQRDFSHEQLAKHHHYLKDQMFTPGSPGSSDLLTPNHIDPQHYRRVRPKLQDQYQTTTHKVRL